MTDLAALADKIDPRKKPGAFIVLHGQRYANWPSSDADLIAASDALRSLAVVRAMALEDAAMIAVRKAEACTDAGDSGACYACLEIAHGIRSLSPITPAAREELVEKVARAICKSRTCEGVSCCQWPANGGRTKCPVKAGGYDDAATAAIAALLSHSNDRA